MKFTEYFKNKVLQKRPYIKMEWIEKALSEPIKIEKQVDINRIRYWVYIDEIDKYLRVVTLNDGETVHNAFPDRSFKLERQ
jgi:hypothetical protein